MKPEPNLLMNGADQPEAVFTKQMIQELITAMGHGDIVITIDVREVYRSSRRAGWDAQRRSGRSLYDFTK